MNITTLKNAVKKMFVLAAVVGLLFVATPLATHADPAADACAGIEAAGGKCSSADGAETLEPIITAIIRVLSIVVGAVSVIMIIIGGLRYVLANGDSNAVSGAKNTIMYAVIGLVIVLFAQVIVSFVYSTATAPAGGSSSNSSGDDAEGETPPAETEDGN